MSEARPFTHLVVVGSSAGGIEALSKLVSALPENFPAPIVVAQHLDPERESRLKEILERRSTLPVRTLLEQESLPLEAGVVFVAPANRHVDVTGAELLLDEDDHGRPKPSIDLIFASAAEVYGERLTVVVLTGTGHDGTEGARAVKKAGGTVIIQNPETAAHPGMPQSLAPSTVDIVADLDRIGPALYELLAGIEVPPRPEEKKKLERFLEDVRENNGIDFRSYKTPTIFRRLQRRIVATTSSDLDGYVGYLEDHPEEYQELVNAFLIKVTEFFRDRELFDFLREKLVPELVEKAKDNQLRIWSAGCATGEEAYSMAILVSEALRDEAMSDNFDVRIFATDVDEAAVEFARHGIYPGSALSGLPEDLVERYFSSENGAYHVSKQVRSMIVFGQHDLARRAPFPRMDLVVCRNVLIYFTAELQKRALQLFAYSLRDDGYLLLGKSETPSPLREYFDTYDGKHKIYRRRGERFLMPPIGSKMPTPLHGDRPANDARLRLESVRERAETRDLQAETLRRFPVGVVAVDRHYDILSLNTAARRLLAINDPAVGEDLLHMVRGAHYARLRAAIDDAFREERQAAVSDFTVEEVTTGEARYMELTCHPRREEGGGGLVDSVMIVVHDVTNLTRARREAEEKLRIAAAELERTRHETREESERQEALNRRLVETNRELVEANQDLTGINEELQATSEQYLVNSEETQAATEEVETLNEELQATNEELETLNEELQATIEELNTTNEDLHARGVQMQEYARESEEEQSNSRSLLQRLPDAVLAVDAEGLVLFANAAFAETFGATREGEMPPQSFVPRNEGGQALPPEEQPQTRAARGESFRMEFSAETTSGAVGSFEATGRPNGDRRGGVVVVREVGR